MSPFWNGFFEQLKDCGRNATVFLVAIFVLFGIALAGVVARKEEIPISIEPVILAFAAAGAILLISLLRRGNDDGTAGRGRFPKLSDDELRVARERLKGAGTGRRGSTG
jgi:hypothetical protein